MSKVMDEKNGSAAMMKLEGFWVRMVERAGALGILIFVLYYVFTSLIPQAQAQFKVTLDDQRNAFLEALKAERESYQESLKGQREDFINTLERNKK